jgi:hypothetical protein
LEVSEEKCRAEFMSKVTSGKGQQRKEEVKYFKAILDHEKNEL